jgi:asparagine synthase (glutamine-hydrolysing)
LSGFVCILHGDDAPVERALLESLTDFLSFQGPDAQEIWLDGAIGMGHALLRTTFESKDERQPANLDGSYRIVADARLDAREELIDELQRAGRNVGSNVPDCGLILEAYAAWGTDCIDHLRGDFSFALWDASRKQLFCARDHFGIKPFYYAKLGSLFVLSNTLNCVRLHQSVTDKLNDRAVGDFLLFGLNYDNTTTIFRDIQRLPPAHTLTVSSGSQVRRYWEPPIDGRIRYSQPQEYVENFRSILEKAVADRLRTDRVGILLSGGLDSSSVASVAKEVSKRATQPTEIRGYTHIYESLIPDQERDFAGEVGEFLRIPLEFIVMDEVRPFERWDDPKLSRPEPVDTPFLSAIFDTNRNISTHGRVLLSGEGSDNLMDFQMWPYVGDLRRHAEWRTLFTSVANYLSVRPFPWRGIRARAIRLFGKAPDKAMYPCWVAPEFSRRLHLVERWKEQRSLAKSWKAHPIHPRGHGSLSLPLWTVLFEQDNPGVTGHHLETRYPFLDLRMVNFLLAIPPFPWFFKKTLPREAMVGRLPESVRIRPKTPLQGDPVVAQMQRNGCTKLKMMSLSAELDSYVDRSAVMAPHAKMNSEQLALSLRPYCFNIWLQSARRVRYNIRAEAVNG